MTSSGPATVHVDASFSAGVEEDGNASTSPTPSWQATSCVVLTAVNATVDGGSCLLDGGEGSSGGDNASTSTTPAAVAQCAVFVQPWALLLLVFPVMTVFGNVLVCLSVYRERNLRTATNFFIVSLAVSDLMVATLVMPFAVYVEVGVVSKSRIQRKTGVGAFACLLGSSYSAKLPTSANIDH